MFGIGAGELIIILIAGLVIFGPSKLPEVGRALGKGLREFRKAQAAFTATLDEVSDENKSTKENKSEPSEDKVSTDKKISLEKNAKSSEQEKSAVSVDEMLELAKSSPLVKENFNEKISNGNDSIPADTGIGKRIEPAGSSGHSAEK